jgi:hypothetical protein
MQTSRQLRLLVLMVHVGASVGSLGAVCAFLVLAIAGFVAPDVIAMQSAYLGMDRIAWVVVLPSVSIALASGLAESLITRYGLFQEKWVVAKLVLTAVALVVLAAKMPLVDEAARLARQGAQDSQLRFAGLQLLVHSAGGLAVLLAALALSIYKPR